MPRNLTKDQRYTKKKREQSKRLTRHGKITDMQITIRVGEEELGLLEMWMAQKELDMTALLEEIIASLPIELSIPVVRNVSCVASVSRVNQVDVWRQSG